VKRRKLNDDGETGATKQDLVEINKPVGKGKAGKAAITAAETKK
jgi:hypothetical protein